jgi:hypothetical protein
MNQILSHNNLELVILQCPYTTYLDDQQTRQMLEQTIKLKYTGYFNKHDRGVQPVDGTDFLSDHVLICKRNEQDELIPLLGSKFLPYDVCGPNNIDFTVEAFLKKEEHHPHLCYLQKELLRANYQNKRVCYHSSWTTHPNATSDREFNKTLKKIFMASSLLYCQEFQVDELYGLGVPKYRTDQFFYTWGYERVAVAGQDLADINFRVLNSISGVFMHLKEFSPDAYKYAEVFNEIWKRKTVIGLSDGQARQRDQQLAA